MRWITLTVTTLLSATTICPTAVGQAAAEYRLGAGRAATTTAPVRNLRTSVSELFGTASKAVQGEMPAGTPVATAPESVPQKPTLSVRPRRPAAAVRKKPAGADTPAAQETIQPPAAPAPTYEDPKKIQAGIGIDEIFRRFGPPSMSITTGPGRSMLQYSGGQANYQVEVEDGKVIAPRHE